MHNWTTVILEESSLHFKLGKPYQTALVVLYSPDLILLMNEDVSEPVFCD